MSHIRPLRWLLLHLCFFSAGLFLFVGALSLVRAADIPGSADHPLVPRYDGAEIIAFQKHAFAQKPLVNDTIRHYGGLEKNPEAVLKLEGALTSLTYRAPAERTALEVFRNYESALEANGFLVLFQCSQADCGGRNFNHAVSPRHYYMGFGEYHADQQYALARLQRPEGDVYVSVYVVLNQSGGGADRHRSLVQLDVLELQPMEQRMVVLDAGALSNQLSVDGKVAVYGILFDLDKDTMRPDSAPQLEEIARLLKQSSNLNVLIVGHTDAQGSLEYNQQLSERRARSVVAALVQQYGIANSRLTPVGVGMVAPVATNRSEPGRAQNRRVELVERLR